MEEIKLTSKDVANLEVLRLAQQVLDRVVQWAQPLDDTDPRDVVGNLLDAAHEYIEAIRRARNVTENK